MRSGSSWTTTTRSVISRGRELIATVERDGGARRLWHSRIRPRWASGRRFVYGEVLEVRRATLAMTGTEATEVSARRSPLWIFGSSSGMARGDRTRRSGGKGGGESYMHRAGRAAQIPRRGAVPSRVTRTSRGAAGVGTSRDPPGSLSRPHLRRARSFYLPRLSFLDSTRARPTSSFIRSLGISCSKSCWLDPTLFDRVREAVEN